jgi:hypothetical protein
MASASQAAATIEPESSDSAVLAPSSLSGGDGPTEIFARGIHEIVLKAGTRIDNQDVRIGINVTGANRGGKAVAAKCKCARVKIFNGDWRFGAEQQNFILPAVFWKAKDLTKLLPSKSAALIRVLPKSRARFIGG